jgi:cob(I)alamin adenosyltransferase
MRITRVYTRTGDAGETRLGGGQKVPKESPRIEAYGTVDELNTVVGLALAFEPTGEVARALVPIQHQLFVLGGDLCVLEEDKGKWTMPSIEQRHVDALEQLIDRLNGDLKPLEEFILPGGTRAAAFLHQARTVCRRAERRLVALAKNEAVGPHVARYINRLSDALFVLARYDNHKAGVEDVYWDKEHA